MIPREIFEEVIGLCHDVKWLAKKTTPLSALMHECSVHPHGIALVSRLIRRFLYCDSSDLETSLRGLCDQITNSWKLDPSDTLIVALNRRPSSDSSSSLLWNLKSFFADKGGWHTGLFIESLATFAHEKIDACKNVVIVDEFSGSGKTIKSAMNWLHGNFSIPDDMKFYLVLHARMQNSIVNYDSFFEDHFSTHVLVRGISDNESNIAEAIETMEQLESCLKEQPDGRAPPSLGYGKCEALYATEAGNTPNNVFPIFWWQHGEIGKRRTMFRRLE